MVMDAETRSAMTSLLSEIRAARAACGRAARRFYGGRNGRRVRRRPSSFMRLRARAVPAARPGAAGCGRPPGWRFRPNHSPGIRVSEGLREE